MATIVKCKKDLFHKNGTQAFTKGRTYEGQNNPETLNGMIVINDLGLPHMIWSFDRQFKIVSR